MPRFIEGRDWHQVTLLPESLDEFIADDNAVRVFDAFVDELDLASLGFDGATPALTGRPGTTRQCCSRSTSTAISIACSRAGVSSANARTTCS